jgi:hypothetical protein
MCKRSGHVDGTAELLVERGFLTETKSKKVGHAGQEMTPLQQVAPRKSQLEGACRPYYLMWLRNKYYLHISV